MAKKKSGTWARRWRRWRKRVIVLSAALVGLVVVGLIVDAVAGKDIRVWWMLRTFEDRLLNREDPEDGEKACQEIRDLGFSYRDALGREVLGGGRSFEVQLKLTRILLERPFHGRKLVEAALEEDDTVVRRAAATVLLSEVDPNSPEANGPLPDPVLAVIRDWCADPTAPWLYAGLMHTRFHRDPRLLDLLLPLLQTRSQEFTSNPTEIGRANRNREQVAQILQGYLPDPRVAEVFNDVVRRDGEADKVQFYVWRALASRGYDTDPELYRIGARAESPFIRQTVAEHMERVNDPRVIPILLELLEDSEELVRRGAVYSLLRKKSPVLLEELYYLAEDCYSFTKGDLATAVGVYVDPEKHRPFLIWCLEDEEPNVVEKAVVELFKQTKKHHGFSEEEWNAYEWNRPLEPGGRHGLIKAFIADRERVEKAVAKWAEEYPPRYRDKDRVPYLIRQLGHADRDNVKKALLELVRITGRTEGFAKELYDPDAGVQPEADAMFRFMKEQREAVIADWKAWYETWDKK